MVKKYPSPAGLGVVLTLLRWLDESRVRWRAVSRRRSPQSGSRSHSRRKADGTIRQDGAETENPFTQVAKYIDNIREGKATPREGRPIPILQNLPFYASPAFHKSVDSHHLQTASAPELILRVPPLQFKRHWPQQNVIGRARHASSFGYRAREHSRDAALRCPVEPPAEFGVGVCLDRQTEISCCYQSPAALLR
jgi:hypothetical protein